MKIATIHRVHDGEEWLEKSVASTHQAYIHIAVANIHDKAGHTYYGGFNKAINMGLFCRVKEAPELEQRITGIQMAHELGCTHYTLIDCDEVYDNYQEILDAVKKHPTKIILVPCRTYFERHCPTGGVKQERFCIEGWDKTFVVAASPIDYLPSYGNFNYYKGQIDPTRNPVSPDGFMIAKTYVHHYSWCRKDMNSIRRKVAASTASQNITRSGIMDYLTTAKEGDVLPIFGKRIVNESKWKEEEYEQLLL